jgi:hypothetical protein
MEIGNPTSGPVTSNIIHVDCVIRSPSMEESSSPKHLTKCDSGGRYEVSWGWTTRCSMCICLAIVVGTLLAMCLLSKAAHASRVWSAFETTFISVSCAYLFLIILVSPSSLTRDASNMLAIRVSPFEFSVFKLNIFRIASVSRLTSWRTLVNGKFVGFPTDFKRSIELRMINGRRIVVSLKNPDGFIQEMNRIILS